MVPLVLLKRHIATTPCPLSLAINGDSAMLAQSFSLRRYAAPTDVANLMLFLASEESSFLSGSVYSVDGGMNA